MSFLWKNTPICHKHVLKEWLKSGYIFENKYYDTNEGTPQGAIISPLLCNVGLNGIEKEIRNIFPVNKTMKEGKPKVYVSRFAVDIIITGKIVKLLPLLNKLSKIYWKKQKTKNKKRVEYKERVFIFKSLCF